MVRSGRFSRFWGVDAYADGHSVQEYKKALMATGMWANYRLLRMSFSDAVDLFPNSYFDFIYIDGYAHTGEEGGRTFQDWYPKLKPGGIFAGDDYSVEAWPLVVWAVNEVAAQLGSTVNVTDIVLNTEYNRYASWFIVRPQTGPDELEFSDALGSVAQIP